MVYEAAERAVVNTTVGFRAAAVFEATIGVVVIAGAVFHIRPGLGARVGSTSLG